MKIDGRTLDHASLETIRRMAVRRVRDGEEPSAVVRSYGFCRTTIYRWLRAEKRSGERALAARKGTGRPPELTPKQKEKVRQWINGKDPRQYGFDFGLWTRQIVVELIERKFSKRLSVTTAGRLLAELGITPQKPLRRAYQRDPQAIERWKREEYPAIRRRAKRRGADIFFLDEAGIRSDAPPGRTWGLRGQTPVVNTDGRRQSVNAISAVNAKGAFWYQTYTGRLNAPTYIEFLRKFLRTRRRPVTLIVDSHPAHIAKMTARFVQDAEGKLEMFFLPGYAPDLNPDEFVWNHVKTHGLSKRPLNQGESLRDRMERDLSAVKNDRPLVRSFFQAESVDYIMN